ncbi:MAG: hypothetical protein RL518_2513 [Pseudomonadota bacterium]
MRNVSLASITSVCCQLGLACIALFMAFGAPLVYGQSGSPGSFYDKNYAGAPNISGQGMQLPPQDPAPVVRPKEGAPPAQKAPAVASVAAANSSRPQPAQPRMRITLYVASNDKRHFEEVMRTAFKVAGKNPSVLLVEIYHIGDHRNVSDAIKNEAAARKIYLGAVHRPPQRLNIESSPAWVLRDSKGIHIVEGIMAIDKCIDREGEYREPERSMFEVPATPTAGVKSF